MDVSLVSCGVSALELSSSPLTRGRINNTDQVDNSSSPKTRRSIQSNPNFDNNHKTNQRNTYNSFADIMADAYALPSLYIAPPDAKRPALKKYGDVRPDFRTNDPNLSTPSAKLNSRNSF